jgi:TolB protein
MKRAAVSHWRLAIGRWHVCIAVMLGVVLPPSLSAQDPPQGVRIGLTYAAGVKPGIIVLPVEPATPGDSVRAILERDFDFGDRLTVISLDTATLRGLGPRAGRVNYALFARLGAAAIVLAQPVASGYRVTVHDVAAGRVLQTEQFPVLPARHSPDWRMAVHGIADEIERWLLGRRGIAQTRIVFSRGGVIHVIDSDGANTRRLPSTGFAMSPAWHPDGDLIAYSSMTDAGTRIVLQNMRDNTRRTLRATTSSLNISPTFSPDGRYVLYATGRESGTDLVATPLRNLGAAQLVAYGRGSDNTSPTYSPDGRRIAFTSGRAGQPEVYIADADGTNAQLLTEFTYGGTTYRASPAWSPDGRLIAYQGTVGGFQLMVLNLRDRTVRQLTSEGSNEDPSWAPDGRHLVFTSTRSGVPQIWIVDVETGRLRQLTRASGARLAEWSPTLAPSRELRASNGNPTND